MTRLISADSRRSAPHFASGGAERRMQLARPRRGEIIMPNRMEQAASKAMGAIKTAKATIEGLSGVFKQLTKEHGEVTALLMRVKMSSDVRVRRELFPKIRSELLSHEKGELREVYPAFRQHAELEGIAAEHEKEAGQMERMLDELSAITYEDASWPAKFAKLADAVAHHAKEEENEYFPAANDLFGKDEAERIGARYLRAKAETQRSS
jgi:hypothetical protein